MMFGLFRRKDPVCGMKEEKGKGIEKESKWFCSKDCMKKYETKNKEIHGKKSEQHSCCH